MLKAIWGVKRDDGDNVFWEIEDNHLDRILSSSTAYQILDIVKIRDSHDPVINISVYGRLEASEEEKS